MSNEMNLYIMSADDIARWYKGTNAAEDYLINIIKELVDRDHNNYLVLDDAYQELEADLEELQMDFSRLEDENLDLVAECRSQEVKIYELEANIEDLKMEIVDLKKSLIAAEVQVIDFEYESRKMEKELQNSEEDNDAQAEHIIALEAELADALNRAESAEAEVQDLTRRIDSLL